MKLLLNRRFLGESYTIGDLFIDDAFYGNTLEDKVRDGNMDGDLTDPGEEKIYGQTAIPYGKYKVILSFSNRFKRILPLLLDVPHFTGIRIHPGNTAEDTHGCILVGLNSEKGKVLSSQETFNRVMARLLEADHRKEFIEIEIVKT